MVTPIYKGFIRGAQDHEHHVGVNVEQQLFVVEYSHDAYENLVVFQLRRQAEFLHFLDYHKNGGLDQFVLPIVVNGILEFLLEFVDLGSFGFVKLVFLILLFISLDKFVLRSVHHHFLFFQYQVNCSAHLESELLAFGVLGQAVVFGDKCVKVVL